MKLLFDTCVSNSICSQLRAVGHDVVWAGDWSADPGDEEILSAAHREERILVTLDKDFGEIVILGGAPHSGIIRLVDFSLEQQTAVCLDVLSRHGDTLKSGAIVTAEPGRLRIRSPG